MEIDKRVYDAGFTRDLIIYLHNKTKLRNFNIEKVHLVGKNIFTPWMSIKPIITIQLELINKGGKRQMSIDITEDKLLKIKRGLKIESLGI
jgi:hypothetical protein